MKSDIFLLSLKKSHDKFSSRWVRKFLTSVEITKSRLQTTTPTKAKSDSVLRCGEIPAFAGMTEENRAF